MADDPFAPIHRAFERAAAQFNSRLEKAERLRLAISKAPVLQGRIPPTRKPPSRRPPPLLPMPVRPKRTKNLSGGAAAPIDDRDRIDARDQ